MKSDRHRAIIICVWLVVCQICCDEVAAAAPDIVDTRLLKTQGKVCVLYL